MIFHRDDPLYTRRINEYLFIFFFSYTQTLRIVNANDTFYINELLQIGGGGTLSVVGAYTQYTVWALCVC